MKKVIAITGGGTGGHIYPGLAIAQSIEAQYPDYRVHFVGAQGGLEEKILPQYPYSYDLIKVGRLHSSVGRWQQIKTLLLMPFSLLHAIYIFFKIRPTWVLGVGGFASGPFLLIAKILGAKTALWEANAYPGLTNRWLAKLVDVNFVVFPEAKVFLHGQKVIESGMPVRKEFFVKSETKLSSEKMKVLIFGGSQGAKAINDFMVQLIKAHPELLEKMEVKHQTGSRDFARMKEQYGALTDKVQLLEYIHNMPSELSAADLVICRAGASTVAEVISCRKPAIFIPLPTAADNHQYTNAKVVVDAQAGFLVQQKNLSIEDFKIQLLELAEQREKLQKISENLQKFDFSQSTQKIVDALMKGSL